MEDIPKPVPVVVWPPKPVVAAGLPNMLPPVVAAGLPNILPPVVPVAGLAPNKLPPEVPEAAGLAPNNPVPELVAGLDPNMLPPVPVLVPEVEAPNAEVVDFEPPKRPPEVPLAAGLAPKRPVGLLTCFCSCPPKRPMKDYVIVKYLTYLLQLTHLSWSGLEWSGSQMGRTISSFA